MIKPRIAVVGPEPLTADICEVAAEFKNVETSCIIYQTAEESAQLVKQYQKEADIFMFAGPTPYTIAKGSIPSGSKSCYLPFEGADIYRVLLKIYEQCHGYPIISFDIVEQQDLTEIYYELGIPHTPYYLFSMKGEAVDSAELVNYHLNLLQKGKAEVIATTLNSVFEQLQQMKVPVFLIKHTKAKIRDTLQKVILKEEKQKKEEGQITVLQFQVLNEASDDSIPLLPDYKLIKNKILEYGGSLFSSMHLIDKQMITLYTTRGVFEKVTNKRQDFSFLDDLNTLSAFKVNLGIGIGNTAENAAYNAKNALEFSIRKKKGSCFLIDEHKRIYGPLGTVKSMNYTLLSSTDEIKNSLTLRKFYAWLSMMRKCDVTTREISMGMNTSERHAARILKNLCQRNIANIIGKESLNQKGRPRLIYKIDLHELANLIQESVR
ncbi:hypothetical protein [Bacillus benzoevorans]|uniref:Transcriptional regulator n=1 Tax=Bacillus benzoevorans TaxID=1456 RepID=A0A7X0HSR5_9BACI|nr:hypothetical protein [Bacillus benzoevorans]MBB6446184.1 hypothetical protein [Bacillus benzoevorans]